MVTSPQAPGRHAMSLPGHAVTAGIALALLLVAGPAPPAGAEGGSGHDGHDRETPAQPSDGGAGRRTPERAPPPRSGVVVSARPGELAGKLAAAPAGATVVVEPGVHRGPFTVDRPLALAGRGRPVLDGDGAGHVLHVRAPGTRVRRLRVRNGGPGPVGAPAGVLVEADDVTIEDVVMEDVYLGIAVNGAARVRLVGNRVHGRGGRIHDGDSSMHEAPGWGPGDGISIWKSKDVLVQDNAVHHVRDGVYVSYGTDVFVDQNRVTASRFGLHAMYGEGLTVAENRFERNLAGAVLMYGGPVLALRNRMTDNRSPTGFGVLVKDVADVRIAENVLARNRIGVQVEGAPLGEDHPTILVTNTIALNDQGLVSYPTARVQAGGNSFAENAVQVAAQGHNGLGGVTWMYEGTGNYWSDYRGYDADGDGVGDVPHPVGGSVDRLLTRSPVLTALASSPAFRLIRAIEERWLGEHPAAFAPMPLMKPPHSPPVDVAPPRTRPAAATSSAGAALAAGVVMAAWRLRSPRRTRRHSLGSGGLRHAGG